MQTCELFYVHFTYLVARLLPVHNVTVCAHECICSASDVDLANCQ